MLVGRCRRPHIPRQLTLGRPCYAAAVTPAFSLPHRIPPPLWEHPVKLDPPHSHQPPHVPLVQIPSLPEFDELHKTLTRFIEKPSTAESRHRFEVFFHGLPRPNLDRSLYALIAKVAAHQRKPTLANLILNEAHQHGIQLNVGVYEHVAFHLASYGAWPQVKYIVDLGNAHTGRWSTRLLDWRLRAYCELNFYHDLRTALSWYAPEDGVPPTRRTYTLLVRASVTNGDVAWTRDVLASMEEAGFPFDVTTYVALLVGHRAIGPSHDVEARTYQALKKLGMIQQPYVLTTLMQLRVDARDMNGATKVLQSFQESTDGTLDDIYTVQALDDAGLLTPGAINPFPPLPTLHLSSVPAFSVDTTPDIGTFAVLLNQCAKQNDASRAKAIYFEMLRLGIVPNDVVLAALMRNVLSSYDGAPTLAYRIRDAARLVAAAAHGSKNSRAAHNFIRTLLHYYPAELHSNPYSGFEDIINHHIPQIPVTSYLFNTLLYALFLRDTTRRFTAESQSQSSARILQMVAFLRQMRQAGVEPDTTTLEVLLKHLGNDLRLMPEAFAQVFNTIHNIGATNPSSNFDPSSLLTLTLPNLTHLNIVFRRIVQREYREHRLSGAVPLVHAPQTTDSSTRSEKYLLRIPSLSSAIDALDAQGIKPNSVTHNLRIQHLSTTSRRSRTGTSHPAFDAFQSMLDAGIPPKPMHYITLMRSFASHGELAVAKEILGDALKKTGVVAVVAMVTVLIVGYGRIRAPDLAEREFEGMQRDWGVTPDVASVDALAMAWSRNGREGDAKRVILENWTKIGGPEFVEGEAGVGDAAAAAAARKLHFREAMAELSLKAMLAALRALDGAHRKGRGRAGIAMRTKVTKKLVDRVIKSWAEGSQVKAPKLPTRRGPK